VRDKEVKSLVGVLTGPLCLSHVCYRAEILPHNLAAVVKVIYLNVFVVLRGKTKGTISRQAYISTLF